MEVRAIKEDYGLRTEQRVLDELSRRKLPCEPRVHIGDLEVDILVGERICVEVDGYYHALKEKVSKDATKEKHLESLGYVVLRINAADAKNRRRLREFASSVVKVYDEERNRESQREKALTRGIPQEELQQLKVKLEKEREKEKQAEEQAEKQESIRAKKLTDEELFLQAIEDLSKRGRK
ncbi:MAG TPA: hypothetical protein DDZ66_00875 [Firmicutes bacterium]|jgi:very-short-patch-repair endonuclease|nr:hypothetical protein [Bacillota bacterium]